MDSIAHSIRDKPIDDATIALMKSKGHGSRPRRLRGKCRHLLTPITGLVG